MFLSINKYFFKFVDRQTSPYRYPVSQVALIEGMLKYFDFCPVLRVHIWLCILSLHSASIGMIVNRRLLDVLLKSQRESSHQTCRCVYAVVLFYLQIANFVLVEKYLLLNRKANDIWDIGNYITTNMQLLYYILKILISTGEPQAGSNKSVIQLLVRNPNIYLGLRCR